MSMKDSKASFRGKVRLSLVAIVIFTGIFASVGGAFAQDAGASITPEKASVQKIGLIAAAVAFGLGALSAGFAISHVGSAAMGAMGEKPEIGSQALIFIALAEGLVVFGFITALMILGKF